MVPELLREPGTNECDSNALCGEVRPHLRFVYLLLLTICGLQNPVTDSAPCHAVLRFDERSEQCFHHFQSLVALLFTVFLCKTSIIWAKLVIRLVECNSRGHILIIDSRIESFMGCPLCPIMDIVHVRGALKCTGSGLL